MIRVLLVDDEILVRTGLKMLIDWEAEGLTVVGEAADGREALEMAGALQPDIVLTDIVMPRMDGLELMRELADTGFSGAVAVLSHHGDFSYTREALRNGAVDYILKTDLNKASFLEFIRAVARRTLREKKTEHSSGQDDVVYRLKSLATEKDPEERQRIKAALPGEWQNRRFRAGILQIRTPSAVGEDKLAARHLASGVLSADRAVFLDPGADMMHWMVVMFGGPEDLQRPVMENLARRLNDAASAYLQYPVFLGVGHAVSDCGELFGSMERAESLLWDSFFHADWRWAVARDGETAPGAHPRFREISDRLMAPGTGRGRIPLLDDVFQELENSSSPQLLRWFCRRFVGFLNQRNARLGMESPDDVPGRFSPETFWCFDSLQALHAEFKDALQGLEDRQGGTPAGLIGSCLEYIEQNLSRPIGLAEAAAEASLSRSYFSTWFKEKTGGTFCDYLTDRRIEKASSLLDTRPELRVYEVASRVGLRNEKYFSRLFKSKTGMSPRDYRNRNNSTYPKS